MRRTTSPVACGCRRGAQTNTKTEEVNFDVCDQYTLQADAFARAILDDTKPPHTTADALANMRVIERIFKSAESGAWT